MPRGDRTGPMGTGPMTGRAAGYCAGYGMPGYANPAFVGRGFGGGFGRGRGAWGWGRGFGGWGSGWGWRNMYYATGVPGWGRPVGDLDPEAEKQALKTQANAMQGELDAIRKRLEEMEKEDNPK